VNESGDIAAPPIDLPVPQNSETSTDESFSMTEKGLSREYRRMVAAQQGYSVVDCFPDVICAILSAASWNCPNVNALAA
jgi:hypothetical protein